MFTPLKNKKNKFKSTTLGFTLVELIAVVVILGIILLIAVPRITDVINNSRINAFIKNEEMLVNVVRNYLVMNEVVLPTELGDTIEVTLEQLQTAELIDEIVDPSDKSNMCNGYVLITKIGENSYDYTPHLNCVEDIGSAGADELVLHYKFDDFQEPTENLIYNPLFNGTIGNDRPTGWNKLGSGDSYLTESSVVTYVQAWEMSVQSSDGPTDNRVRITSPTFNLKANTWYTVSVYVELFDYISGNFPVITISGANVVEGALGLGISSIDELVEIPSYIENSRYIFSFKTGSSSNGSIFIGSPHTSSNGILRVSKVQVEQKPYATAFVDGIREGLVKDYSKNNNNAILDENTPKWVTDSITGEGTYEFDGIVGTTIENNTNVLREEEMSVSLWIKPQSLANSQRIVRSFGANSNRFYIMFSSNNITVTRGNNINRQALYPMSVGEWYHIFVYWKSEGNILRIYINGEIKYNGNYSKVENGGNQKLKLGTDNSTETNFNGLIDDIRIYNRALSSEEIQMMYRLDTHRGK